MGGGNIAGLFHDAILGSLEARFPEEVGKTLLNALQAPKTLVSFSPSWTDRIRAFWLLLRVLRWFAPLEVIGCRSQKPTKTEKENMKIATVLGLVAALAGFSLSSCGSTPEPAPVPAPVEIPAK